MIAFDKPKLLDKACRSQFAIKSLPMAHLHCTLYIVHCTHPFDMSKNLRSTIIRGCKVYLKSMYKTVLFEFTMCNVQYSTVYIFIFTGKSPIGTETRSEA